MSLQAGLCCAVLPLWLKSNVFFTRLFFFFPLTLALVMLLCQEFIPVILMEQLAMLNSFAINSAVIVTCPIFQINWSNICFRAKFNYKLGAFAFSIITVLNDCFNCKLWTEGEKKREGPDFHSKHSKGTIRTFYHLDYHLDLNTFVKYKAMLAYAEAWDCVED